MSEETREFREGWRVLVAAAFGVGVGLTGAPIFSLGTFLVPLSQAFGWSRTQVSIASLFLVTGTLATAPLVGWAADRFGVRRIGLVSILLLAAAMVGMTQIGPSIESFYIALVLLSLAGCGTTPTIWTRGVATWFDRKRGFALGLTLAGTGVAAMIMPPLIGELIARFDWRAGYIGLAVITLFAAIPVTLFFYEAGRDGRGLSRTRAVLTGMETRQALKTRRFWQLGLGNILVTGIVAALTVHLIAMLTDAGIERPTALRIASLVGVAIIVGRLSMGFLLDKLHAPYVAFGFILLPCIGCMILAEGSQSLVLLGFAALTIGLAAGAEIDLLAYLTSRYFGLKSYGAIYGWQFILFELGVGLGPLLAGRAYDLQHSYQNALYVGAAGFAVAAVAMATLGRPPKFE